MDIIEGGNNARNLRNNGVIVNYGWITKNKTTNNSNIRWKSYSKKINNSQAVIRHTTNMGNFKEWNKNLFFVKCCSLFIKKKILKFWRILKNLYYLYIYLLRLALLHLPNIASQYITNTSSYGIFYQKKGKYFGITKMVGKLSIIIKKSKFIILTYLPLILK